MLGRSFVKTNDLDNDGVSDFIFGTPGDFCEGLPYGSISLFSVLHQSFSKKFCYTNFNYKIGSHIDFIANTSTLIFGGRYSLFSQRTYDLFRYPDLTDTNRYPITSIPEMHSFSPAYYNSSTAKTDIMIGNYEDSIYRDENNVSISPAISKAGTLSIYQISGGTRTAQCIYQALEANGRFGSGAEFVEDLSGDGIRDLIVGQPGKNLGGGSSGRVYLIKGDEVACTGGTSKRIDIDASDPAETISTIDANSPKITSFIGRNAQPDFGKYVRILPDFDQTDGIDKPFIFISNSNAQAGADTVTPEYFIIKLLADNSFEIVKHEIGVSEGMLGSSIKVIEDINGDGTEELAISYPGGTGRLGATGHVAILSGKALTTASPDDDVLQMLFSPEPSFSNFGVSFEYGDMTGDGLNDFIVGADKYDSTRHTDAGAIFIFPMTPIQE